MKKPQFIQSSQSAVKSTSFYPGNSAGFKARAGSGSPIRETEGEEQD